MPTRLISTLRTLGWIGAAALAGVVASERVYWYWSGIDVDSLGVLILYYAPAVAVAFIALATSPGSGWRRAVIGSAAYALVVEGVVTPVIYEDGPLPLLFLMFVGWHGILAFVGFVYAIRRWALAGQTVRIAVASVITGIGWGVWALSSAVSDTQTAQELAADGGASTEILGPVDFAIYAGWTGLALVAAHLAADRWWPAPGWRPTRTGLVATGLWATFLTVTLVVLAVPWAPAKLAVLAWVIRKLLRRTEAPAGSPTVIDELSGRASLRSFGALAALPLTASATYFALWPLRDADAMRGTWGALILLQVGGGVVALIWAARRRSAPDQSPVKMASISSACS